MISFDFEYFKPTSTEEAIKRFEDLYSQNKKVIYYGGGTELISRARRNELNVDAVIDLKGIPACHAFNLEENQIIIGAATTLTAIADSNLFPLLANVSRAIASRTPRNKITIGGNISGNLFYREAILPFLLADSEIVIAGKEGVRKANINEIFEKGVQLQEEEFVVQIITDSKFTQYPYTNSKKTKQSKVNYPIASVASLQVDDHIRVAFSGVCPFPFRLEEIESVLNNTSLSIETRSRDAMNHLPAPILDDMYASADYRKFVLENVLTELLKKMEGAS